MSSEDADYLWGKRHSVLYRLELSALYHQKRERFFDLCDKLAKVVAIVGGSAALYKVADEGALVWIAATITIASALSLVMGFSEKARRHAELTRSFKQIQADALRCGERDFTEADIADWAARVAALEASEPPALGVLVRICQNELARAADADASVKPVGWRWLVAHLLDVPLPQAK